VSTTFDVPANDFGTTLGSPYSAGSGSVVMVAAAGAALTSALSELGLSLSATSPLAFTLRKKVSGAPSTNRADATIFQATGLSTDTLTGVTVAEGTHDQNFAAGDYLDVLMTAGRLSKVYGAVNTMETTRAFKVVNSIADLNAIPDSDRQEGMVVYVKGVQVMYQLLPTVSAYLHTINDWTQFGNIPPFAVPYFMFVEIANQASLVAVGTSVGGSVTFRWKTLNSANVQANSVSIIDVTTSTTVASGLPDSGTANVTIPSVSNASPATHRWRITANDLKGNAFSLDMTVQWLTLSNKTYYVNAATGSDGNNGTSSGTAWQTLTKVSNTQLGPGDTVNVAAGNYAGVDMDWNFPVVGCSGHPIRFLGTGNPVINSRAIHTFNCFNFENCSYVTVDGFTIAPTDVAVKHKAGIRMSGLNANVGCPEGNIIQNCTCTMIAGDNYGIFTAFQKNVLVYNNTISGINAGTSAVAVYTANSQLYFVVRKNTVHDCTSDGLHFNGDLSAGLPGVSWGGLVELNTVHDIGQLKSGSAINCDGQQNTTIQNNLCYNLSSAGISLYHDTSAFGSVGCAVVNNTIVLGGSSPKSCLHVTAASTGCTVFDNIFVTTSTVAPLSLLLSDDSRAGFFCDYNAYANGTEFSVTDGDGLLVLSTWQGQGYDTHGATGTPSSFFTNLGSNDYTESVTAPAASINLGVATFNGINAPSPDFAGRARPQAGAWDAGCYQTADIPRVVSRSPTNLQVNVPRGTTITATFQESVAAVNPTWSVLDANTGLTVAGSTSYNNGTFTSTFTPSALLNDNDSFQVTLSGGQNAGGGVMSPTVWTFYTGAPQETIFGTILSNYTNGDGTARVYGTQFHPTINGNLTGVTFWKIDNATLPASRNVWLVRKDGTTCTILNKWTTVSEPDGSAGGITVTVPGITPVALVSGTTYAILIQSVTGVHPPEMKATALGDVNEYFFVNHDPWTNTFGHLVAPGHTSAGGPNCLWYNNASTIPPASWSSFAEGEHASNPGVDIQFQATG